MMKEKIDSSKILKISKNKQPEDRIRELDLSFNFLFENAPIMVFLNLEGRIVYANRFCEEIMGYTKEEFYAPGFNFINLIDPSYSKAVEKSFRIHMNGKEIPSCEYALTTKGGVKIHILLNTKLIYVDGKKVILGIATDISELKHVEAVLSENEERLRNFYNNVTIGLSQTASDGKILFANPSLIQILGFDTLDITSRKLAELQIIRQNEKLMELNTMKDKFFSIISHDLKNPLNVILGFINVLTTEFEELETKEVQKYLSIINESSKQLNSILENLLLWANTHQNHINFQPEVFNLHTCITEQISIIRNQAEKKQISIHYNQRKICFVFADKKMIGNILYNLLTNAIKFTYKTGNITLSHTHHNDQIIVSIKDDGVGINPDDMEYLFSISKKTSKLGTDNEKGNGFGLILCKEFAERNGGKIWAESKPGLGSTFKFTIPDK